MGKSAQTIGYWYKLAIHFGLCKGPVDAILEIRGGDRPAWTGEQTASGTITINAPNLWGGEKAEGGIVSDLDVMMGEAAQAPNAYLTTVFGGVQSAFRGLLTAVFKGGKYGAFNPYPKPMAFKVRRILQGWDNDTCWYPEKAPIPFDESEAVVWLEADATGWEFQEIAYHATPGYSNLTAPASGYATGQAPFACPGAGPPSGLPVANSNWTIKTILWARKTVSLPSDTYTIKLYAENGACLFIDGVFIGAANRSNTDLTGWGSEQAKTFLYTGAIGEISIKAFDETNGVGKTYAAVQILGEIPGPLAMNPAHILYDSITSLDGQGEPIGMINEASFTAAADQLFAEGFGLCMTYGGEESIESFQQRVCDIIGACLTQSRVNGQYYLDLVRGDYVLEDLMIIGEDDVIEFSQEPAILTEAINQILVDWFDVETRQDRTTSPAQSLGLIATNGVISETRSYRPIPYEELANRVAARDVHASSTPLSKFTLTCTRKPYSLRPGQPFRLQLPSEGLDDVVCRLGSIDHGTLTDGRIRIVALQDVFTLPDAGSVVTVPGDAEPPGSTPPAAALAEIVIEAPYFELAGQLGAADISALTDEAGFLLTLAVRPHALSNNYSLYTAADGETYADRGLADWCPSALVVESATADPAEDAFTLASGVDLENVEVGMAALWGDEIGRVDAIDAVAGTLTLARGCGDTVPGEHTAGERIWFFEGYAGADSREYSVGELVHAKVLARTSADELALGDATELDLTIAGRASLPYAPGQFQINGSALPTSESGALAVTWVHRNRILTADQLLESAAAGVTVEPGVQYAVTLKNNLGAVLHESDPISGTSYTFTYTYTGTATLELKAIRGALESWQIHSRTFTYTGASTSIPTVPPGPGVDLEPLDGTELVAIEQDGVAKECTTQAIADLAQAFTTSAIAAALELVSWKAPVRVATTAAGTLATSFENGDTIDGVVLATGDRILIKDQAAGAENGIYVVAASGAPSRAADASVAAELLGAAVIVAEGTVNADQQYRCTTNAPIVLGTTALAFGSLGAGSSAVAADTHAASDKATPVDADELPLIDSAASWVLKKLTLANLKAYLKTYFDTLYAAVAGSGALVHLGTVTVSGGAVTFVEVSGINGALYSSLTINLSLKAPVAGATLSFYVGYDGGAANTTAANYYRQSHNVDNGSVTAARANAGTFASIGASGYLSGDGRVQQGVDGKAVAVFQTHSGPASSILQRTYGVHANVAGTDITTVRIAGNLDNGSQVSVYGVVK